MASELVSQDALGVTPYIALAVDLFLMMTLVRTRSKIRRWIAVALGLTATSFAALVTIGAFSEYSLDPAHILSHSMFSAIILLYGRLLVTHGVPAILDRLIFLESETFDRFQYTFAQTMMSGFERIRAFLELGVFDRSQYTFARTIESLAGGTRRIHTGNLNVNMICFLVGFVVCLLLLLRFMSP